MCPASPVLTFLSSSASVPPTDDHPPPGWRYATYLWIITLISHPNFPLSSTRSGKSISHLPRVLCGGFLPPRYPVPGLTSEDPEAITRRIWKGYTTRKGHCLGTLTGSKRSPDKANEISSAATTQHISYRSGKKDHLNGRGAGLRVSATWRTIAAQGPPWFAKLWGFLEAFNLSCRGERSGIMICWCQSWRWWQ